MLGDVGFLTGFLMYVIIIFTSVVDAIVVISSIGSMNIGSVCVGAERELLLSG